MERRKYYTEEERDELRATGRDYDTGEYVFEIDVRPVIYHEVKVWVENGERFQIISPVSVGIGYGVSATHIDINDGETIISCVPAMPGTYMVYACARRLPVTGETEVCIGTVVGHGNADYLESYDQDLWIRRGAMFAMRYGW